MPLRRTDARVAQQISRRLFAATVRRVIGCLRAQVVEPHLFDLFRQAWHGNGCRRSRLVELRVAQAPSVAFHLD